MSSKLAPSTISPIYPAAGTLIDREALQLVEVLGVGGYGVVYRAIDQRYPSKSYAVKCLVASGPQASRQRQFHIREVALHQLASAHPGVVTLHRVFEQENYTYIVMDYAADHDLFTQILHNCRYLGQNDLIKDIFLQLIDAVQYCHSLGIYHRDLKPENIVCFDGGLRIAVTDFGLATTDKASDNFRTGSVYHMSPEGHGGNSAPNGHYSPMSNDIWSLGIILLNLLTGCSPWRSATLDDPAFQTYLQDPEGFLISILPISSEVNDILVRMLDVDWRDRANLDDVRHAIEQVSSFYSEDVIFEGSMARWRWESGTDADSTSSGSIVRVSGLSSPPAQSSFSNKVSRRLTFHCIEDPSSSMVFTAPSYTAELSYGQSWNSYSSCGATWDSESSLSSDSDYDRGFRMDFDRAHKSDTFKLTFGAKPDKPDLRLIINSNMSPPRIYDADPSMTSFSPNTSIVHTAVEYDPYYSMFFVDFRTSPKQQRSVGMPDSAPTTAPMDKEMTSTTTWWSAISTSQTSSPSIDSDSAASLVKTSVSSVRRHPRPRPTSVPGSRALCTNICKPCTRNSVMSPHPFLPQSPSLMFIEASSQRPTSDSTDAAPPCPYPVSHPPSFACLLPPQPESQAKCQREESAGAAQAASHRRSASSSSSLAARRCPPQRLRARRSRLDVMLQLEHLIHPFRATKRMFGTAPPRQWGLGNWYRPQQQKGRLAGTVSKCRADSSGSSTGESHQLRSARNWFLPRRFRTGVT